MFQGRSAVIAGRGGDESLAASPALVAAGANVRLIGRRN